MLKLILNFMTSQTEQQINSFIIIYSRHKYPFYSSITVKHKEKTNKHVVNSIEYTQMARPASASINNNFRLCQ